MHWMIAAGSGWQSGTEEALAVEQEAEVIAGGGKDGIDGVAL